ncbi:E3 ubiquitin/ISG15 ligase TRIM25 isoform X1 [Takifugu flavidus]|uniref:E3 ubiquitin-protein ligase TRIM38 n=1 Tax=Takifugu flavidus TaxID=433684 RepID=A0A5C6P9Q6_9TELE|nr:E3 ubiquitin/ISG15 ligase TRIM25 isoform X1 [Takifugu flavidus]TWW75926.1 E3 ubiquitin-protein ligase TRIM38 [Takifugu flavidus]
MGASLETPARCHLCKVESSEPVTLKCKHRFCRRCIEDLWSTVPNGPYRCPEWRCKMVYQTLPFDRTLIPQRASSGLRGAQTRSSAGTSTNEQSTPESALRRPSLAGRLLGKRKASAPAVEQPNPKRLTTEAPRERSGDVETEASAPAPGKPDTKHLTTEAPRDRSGDVETEASAPAPDKPGTKRSAVKQDQSGDVETEVSAPAPDKPDTKRSAVKQEQSGDVESPTTSSSDSFEDTPAPSASPEVSQKSQSKQFEYEDEALDISGQQSIEIISLCDSDSLDEVIISDASPAATPQKGTGETPASPAGADCSAAVPPDKTKSPGPPVNISPVIHLASTSGSPADLGSFSRSESKSARPVPCHYCPNAVYQPAIKTCLVCGASMCSEHLRPHLESPVFQNHTLIAPVEDISSWKCQEHQDINRIYCRKCGVCVCTLCPLVGSHQNHECISLREAERELRGNLKKDISQLQQTEDEVIIRLNEVTQKKEASRVVLEKARTSVLQQYAAIREALDQEEQTALQCVAKEESRVLGGLEEKLGNLRSSLQSIQKGLHIFEGLADAKGDKHIGDQVFVREYSKTAHLSSVLGSYMEQFETPEEVDHARLKCLQKWTEKRLDTFVITVPGEERDIYIPLYGCVPSLDADTAHPKLQLSDNNREVRYSEAQQPYTEHAARFSSFPQVLASSALQGGRWYWEVNVSVEEGRWKVGVSEGRIERKGQKDISRLGCNPYSWCLACDKKKVEALHNRVSAPVDADGLQRVGVFLDFEEGVLSFFNVTPGGSLALVHSYKHSFTDPVYPAFSVSKTHLAICDLFHS